MVEKKKLRVNIPPNKMEALYSDLVIITKNALGVTFDFGQRMPTGERINIISRVAMSPQHAKLFLQLLEKNVADFEDKFGAISLPTDPKLRDDDKMIHFQN